jgi:hypothetical protein
MNKHQKILLTAAAGITGVAVSQAALGGRFGIYGVNILGMPLRVIGLAFISYAAYQTHESLLALFWGALSLIWGYFLVAVSESILMAYLTILLLVIPGIGLTIYGVRLFLKSRREPRR